MPSCVPVNLDDLLIRTDGMSPSQATATAEAYYQQYYVSTSPITQDGQRVWFYSNRFRHAFRRDTTCKGGPKDEIDLNRVQRVRWIGELIAGNVSGCVCRSVPDSKNPERGSNRLYMIDRECYVTWLSPRETGDGWTFSTAYKAFGFQMKKYRQLGEIVWRRK